MKRTNAFTLTELLITVSVIAILAALAMTAFSKITAASQSAQCMANLKTIITATLAYSQENNGYMPPHSGPAFSETSGKEQSRKAKWFWMAHLAPYLGVPDSSGPMSSIFNCPGDPEVKTWPPNRPYIPADSGDKSNMLCSYGFNYYYLTTSRSWWPRGVDSKTGEITHPTNVRTITRPGKLIVYTDGRAAANAPNAPIDPIVSPFSEANRPSLRHSKRFNAVFMDGHAESLNEAAGANVNAYWLPQ